MDREKLWHVIAELQESLDTMATGLAEVVTHLRKQEEEEYERVQSLQRTDHVGDHDDGGEGSSGRSRAEGLRAGEVPSGDGWGEADRAAHRGGEPTADPSGPPSDLSGAPRRVADHVVGLPPTAQHLAGAEFVNITNGAYEGGNARLTQIVDPSGFGLYFGDLEVLDEEGRVVDHVRVRVQHLTPR